jgi:stage II sporulation protein D
VSLDEWRNYLISKGLQVPEGSTDFAFAQPTRKAAYVYHTASIPTKTIRADWGLRSSFFDLTVKGDSLVFDGRGYGHGVGLSQEGAMNMARQGFKYDQIINQYYQGVNIISVRALNFFQVEQ